MTVEKAALFMPDTKMQKTMSFPNPLATYVRTRVKEGTESFKKVSAFDPTNLAEPSQAIPSIGIRVCNASFSGTQFTRRLSTSRRLLGIRETEFRAHLSHARCAVQIGKRN